MSRVLAILAILLLCLIPLLANLGGDDGEPVKLRGEPDLGQGYAYKTETLRRFRKLVASRDWSLADPRRNPQGMLEAVHEKTGLKFVLIPAASFLMGSPEQEEDRLDDEDLHPVTIRRAFLLCETECTQAAWEQGGGRNGSYRQGANHPVEGVTWTECHAWCKQSGLRLPSEPEWECACRAGTRAPFWTGATLTTDQANYSGNPYARVWPFSSG